MSAEFAIVTVITRMYGLPTYENARINPSVSVKNYRPSKVCETVVCMVINGLFWLTCAAGAPEGEKIKNYRRRRLTVI